MEEWFCRLEFSDGEGRSPRGVAVIWSTPEIVLDSSHRQGGRCEGNLKIHPLEPMLR
jgi:hypothetical protein